MNTNKIITKIFPDKETRKQKSMRNLNEIVAQIVSVSSTEAPNGYYLNALRKNYLNQERIAFSRGGDAEMITQYRKTVERYIKI